VRVHAHEPARTRAVRPDDGDGDDDDDDDDDDCE
jgi:hypothetical protein